MILKKYYVEIGVYLSMRIGRAQYYIKRKWEKRCENVPLL